MKNKNFKKISKKFLKRKIKKEDFIKIGFGLAIFALMFTVAANAQYLSTLLVGPNRGVSGGIQARPAANSGIASTTRSTPAGAVGSQPNGIQARPVAANPGVVSANRTTTADATGSQSGAALQSGSAAQPTAAPRSSIIKRIADKIANRSVDNSGSSTTTTTGTAGTKAASGNLPANDANNNLTPATQNNATARATNNLPVRNRVALPKNGMVTLANGAAVNLKPVTADGAAVETASQTINSGTLSALQNVTAQKTQTVNVSDDNQVALVSPAVAKVQSTLQTNTPEFRQLAKTVRKDYKNFGLGTVSELEKTYLGTVGASSASAEAESAKDINGDSKFTYADVISAVQFHNVVESAEAITESESSTTAVSNASGSNVVSFEIGSQDGDHQVPDEHELNEIGFSLEKEYIGDGQSKVYAVGWVDGEEYSFRWDDEGNFYLDLESDNVNLGVGYDTGDCYSGYGCEYVNNYSYSSIGSGADNYSYDGGSTGNDSDNSSSVGRSDGDTSGSSGGADPADATKGSNYGGGMGGYGTVDPGLGSTNYGMDVFSVDDPSFSVSGPMGGDSGSSGSGSSGNADGGSGDADGNGRGGLSCFVAGTKVRMADGGFKSIEEIKIGEKVVGKNGNTNTVIGYERPIIGSRGTYKINGKIEVTGDHPFLSIDGGWRVANLDQFIAYPRRGLEDITSEMKVGDVLVTEDGQIKVETIDYSRSRPEEETVYDLKLDGDNTYNANGFIVHNC